MERALILGSQNQSAEPYCCVLFLCKNGENNNVLLFTCEHGTQEGTGRQGQTGAEGDFSLASFFP